MITKDIVYLVCFTLILVNLYLKPKVENKVVKAIFLLVVLLVAHYNIFIGVFLGFTFLKSVQ
tara:strand:- start:962 stop:1147 length:186 start_codon:yes stop_codon:yes gene_type:complete